jgi:hypothetical protein
VLEDGDPRKKKWEGQENCGPIPS